MEELTTMYAVEVPLGADWILVTGARWVGATCTICATGNTYYIGGR